MQVKVMFHDDDCGRFLDATGECPRCKFHPDMQSTGFATVSVSYINDSIKSFGRTFLGLYRTPIVKEITEVMVAE